MAGIKAAMKMANADDLKRYRDNLQGASLFTGRNAVFSAGRQPFGGYAAAFAFAIGRLVGVWLGG